MQTDNPSCPSAARSLRSLLLPGLAAALVLACEDPRHEREADGDDTGLSPALAQLPPPASQYGIEFVATAASGAAMNNLGDVAGTSYPDTGCGPFCLPTQDTVVWRGGARIVLPTIPGLPGIYVSSINDQGWVAGIAGLPGTTTHAVVWMPSGSTYTAIDLGTLPGTTISEAIGVDNHGRVIGWSTTSGFPPNGSPFLWTLANGMEDLSAQGYPDEIPKDMSPGGTVVTPSSWYILGDPASVTPIPPPPTGFHPPGGYPAAINDAGDQARFLITTSSSSSLVYPFRLPHNGVWQQISTVGTGHLSSYGLGSINAALDITATVLSSGIIAAGPAGTGQSLSLLVSPAYPGVTVTSGGPMNDAGRILTQAMIGRSSRLVRMVPVTACVHDCLQVATLTMRGVFVQDPAHPGSCYPGGSAYNSVTARAKVTDENGTPRSGVLVKGRFLDDYWTNRPVSGRTNAQGIVQFTNNGPCGVGAVAFLVGNATGGTRTLDRTVGELSDWVIPQ